MAHLTDRERENQQLLRDTSKTFRRFVTTLPGTSAPREVWAIRCGRWLPTLVGVRKRLNKAQKKAAKRLRVREMKRATR